MGPRSLPIGVSVPPAACSGHSLTTATIRLEPAMVLKRPRLSLVATCMMAGWPGLREIQTAACENPAEAPGSWCGVKRTRRTIVLSMTYCFDIDGTICTDTDGDYTSAVPFPERIAHVNSLYEQGHTIKFFTARGSTTKLDWRTVTEAQLASWGAQYHELILGKPYADLFIDDKAIHSDEYQW